MAFMDLFARIRLDSSNYDAALRKLEQRTSAFGSRIAKDIGSKLATVFSVAALTTFTKGMAEFGDRIQTLSDRTGVSAQELQVLNFVASETGIALEDITQALKGLAKARSDVLTGPVGSRKEGFFAALGADRDELSVARELLPLFVRLIGAIRTAGSSADQLAFLQEIFTEAGVKIAPLLNANLSEMVTRFNDLGLAVSDANIAQLAKMNAEFRKMGITLKSVLAPTIGELSRTLDRLTSRMGFKANDLGSGLEKWLRMFPNAYSILYWTSRLTGDGGPGPTGLPGGLGFGGLPEPPGSPNAPTPARTNARQNVSQPSDALLAIGNFLGSASPQAAAVQTTAQNTTNIRHNLEAIRFRLELLDLNQPWDLPTFPSSP